MVTQRIVDFICLAVIVMWIVTGADAMITENYQGFQITSPIAVIVVGFVCSREFLSKRTGNNNGS